MLAKRQTIREAIQAALATQTIVVRNSIASEVQAAFEAKQSQITEAIITALENVGIFQD
jgi:hypothetical protein